MANTAQNVGIKNSWTLKNFALSHGKMQLGTFVNGTTGESFRSCIFTNPSDNSRCFVAFSSKMGELSAREIAEQKDQLQVVELESGNFSLCKQDANNWEDVELGF